MRRKLLIIVALLLLLTSCSTGKKPSKDENNLEGIEGALNISVDEATYNFINVDWPIYENTEALVRASDAVLIGKVRDISFQILDDLTGRPPLEETKEGNHILYTIYDVDIIRSYKGDFSNNVKIRMLGGQEGVRIEEQLKTLGEDAKNGITLIKNKPEIDIEETYLFNLEQYTNTMPTLVNMEQGVYQIEDPLKKDWYSFVSAKDIISYFGDDRWDEFVNANQVDSSLQKGNQKFAFDIFKKLNKEDLDDCIFISPLSISQALTMAYNGAESTTKESMAKVLGIEGLEDEIVNRSFRNLTNYLEHSDKKIELNIGNSIWIRDGDKINEEFIQINKDSFNAEVNSLDFSDNYAIDVINDWLDKATKGKITKMLEPPIEDDILMYLINAIYFKGEWSNRFDPELTYKDNFYTKTGEVQTVNMMRRTSGAIEYTGIEEFKAVRLPYGEKKISMYIILPSEGTDINDFVAGMTTEKWYGIRQTIKERDDIVFRIPRFKLDYGTKSLKESLISLGMMEAFSDNADFTGIREQVAIGNVLHRALIEVNEEGSEAAAATVVELVDTAAAEPTTFIADRPFMFIINDDVKDTILFMGKVVAIEE